QGFLKLCYCLFTAIHLRKHIAEFVMRSRETAVHLNRLAICCESLLELARVVEVAASVCVYGKRERLKLLRAFGLRVGFVEAPFGCEHRGVPLMRSRVVGFEFDCSLEILLGFFPVPIEAVTDGRKRSVGFSKSLVKLKSFCRSLLSLRIGFSRRTDVVNVKQPVTVCETGIGWRVIRVLLFSLIEVVYALLQSFRSAFVPVVAALQVELIGFGVGRVVFDELPLLCTREFQTKLVRYV